MKQTAPTIDIGIVAYNEGRNILLVIADVLSQEKERWIFGKLYVSVGGSTDDTVKKVQSLKNPSIVLMLNPKREGKAVDEQKIFDAMTGDALVMFDADVRLEDTHVVTHLVNRLFSTDACQLVGGNPRPYAPTTFVENAVYSTFTVLDASRTGVHGGNNIYGSSGQCLAMKKALAKHIVFPTGIVAEDDFIYFTNKKLGGGFYYVPESIVWYRLPKNFSDYMRQVFRADPLAATANVEGYFGPMVAEEYHRPMSFYAPAVIKSFIRNPVGGVCMIAIRLFSRIAGPIVRKKYTLEWFTATSTK